jgi:Flp pilus assembly protein TadD
MTSWIRDVLLNTAKQAEEAGDLRGAHDALRKALELDQSDWAGWASYGSICNELEQFAAAADAFNRAIQLKRDFAGAYSGLAQALEATGRFEEAERAMKTSLALRPSSPRYVLLSDVQTSVGRDTEAEASLREALRLDPENEEALFNLAINVGSRDADEAIALLERAIDIDPKYAAAYRELGWQLYRRRRLEDADRAVATAIELDPTDAWARLYLAHLLLAREQVQRAVTELERASAFAPFWALPLMLLGKVREDLGRFAEAEQNLRTAVALDDKDADALAELGRFLVARGRVQDGKEMIQKALELAPGHPIAQHVLSSLSS